MSQTKHTPGPWKASEPRFGDRFIRSDPADWDGMGHQLICSVPAARKGTPYGEMFRANANLIAAAPCLLSAAKGLLALLDDGTCTADPEESEIAFARAAIAKAEAA